MIKAIQTQYKGYKFRSRLEARWAVYLDAVNVQWEYEPEGFEFTSGRMYLPDFYLPEFYSYLEIKAKRGNVDDLTNFIIDSNKEGMKLWGLVGDPINASWIMPAQYDNNWKNEWHAETSICFIPDNDGSLMACPTFTDASAKSVTTQMYGSPKRYSEIIDNYQEKIKARSARFEHGESPC